MSLSSVQPECSCAPFALISLNSSVHLSIPLSIYLASPSLAPPSPGRFKDRRLGGWVEGANAIKGCGPPNFSHTYIAKANSPERSAPKETSNYLGEHDDARYEAGSLLSSFNLSPLSVSKLTPSSLFSVLCTCSSRSYCRTDRRKGCYIPDDCHHHRLSVRPALTSQEGNEPASQTAGLRKTNANCPVPLVCIQLSSSDGLTPQRRFRALLLWSCRQRDVHRWRGNWRLGVEGGGLDLYVWSDLSPSSASSAWKKRGERGAGSLLRERTEKWRKERQGDGGLDGKREKKAPAYTENCPPTPPHPIPNPKTYKPCSPSPAFSDVDFATEEPT
ncbi:unnamed protein product [Pleuronectes platessa]|uniref:Uncharacterized protein n=1 Tax=Pleuronectes platessa TaxID=8262 RepID=A0A9N7ZAK2_PLEPL|nr:unnamed protein product [Pleuronectes platessa]